MVGSSGSGLFASKHVRVGVPMLGAVLVGYLSLSTVLDGRIQVRTKQQREEEKEESEDRGVRANRSFLPLHCTHSAEFAASLFPATGPHGKELE